jgi:FkbM family methyltransferase
MFKSLSPFALVRLQEYTRRFERLGFSRRAALCRALRPQGRQHLVTSGVELLPQGLTATKLGYVIDVGANRGQFLESFLSILDAEEIDCFEPNPEACNEIQNAVRAFGWEAKVHVHNIAVGSEPGNLELNVTASSDFSSLLEPLSTLETQFGEPASVVRRVPVAVNRLDDCAKSRPVDLLKVDVQGFERQVIAGATRLLARTKAILMEVSFKPYYRGDSNFFDITRLLSDEHGFELYNLSNPSRDSCNRAGQADAVFVRAGAS